MRIPFIHRKPEDIASIAKRATYVGSAEVSVPRPTRRTTREEVRRARERLNARRNGTSTS